jgi:hypothetical protein
VTFETLVAYWAGDLGAAESDRVEDHVFACAECTAASARVAAISESLRAIVPPIVSPGRVEELRAHGFQIEDNFVAPGARIEVTFRDQDFLIHHLGGLELASAERVKVKVSVEETGSLILEHPSVPFDAKSGEVLIACQPHFAAFPPNIAFDVTATDGSGEVRTARYVVAHDFAPGARTGGTLP